MLIILPLNVNTRVTTLPNNQNYHQILIYLSGCCVVFFLTHFAENATHLNESNSSM